MGKLYLLPYTEMATQRQWSGLDILLVVSCVSEHIFLKPRDPYTVTRDLPTPSPGIFPSAEKYHPGHICPRLGFLWFRVIGLEIGVSVVVKVLGLFGERYRG